MMSYTTSWDTISGQCRCGQVTIEIVAQQLPPLYGCHCLNYQRWSGSAFGLHMLSAASAVQVSGETAIFEHEHQGQTSTQHVCGICHTRLFNETTAAPGMRVWYGPASWMALSVSSQLRISGHGTSSHGWCCRGLSRNGRRARPQKHSPQHSGRRACSFISECAARRAVNCQI